MERFEVATAIGGNWENVWNDVTIVDGAQVNTPITFDSHADACLALHEHLLELTEANMDFAPGDFWIRPVPAIGRP